MSFPTSVTSRRSRALQQLGDASGGRPSRQIGCGRGIGVRAERPGRDDASHAVEAFDDVVPQWPGDPHSMDEDDRRTVTGDVSAERHAVELDGRFGQGHPPERARSGVFSLPSFGARLPTTGCVGAGL